MNAKHITYHMGCGSSNPWKLNVLSPNATTMGMDR